MTDRENLVELALNHIKEEENNEFLQVKDLVKRIKYGEIELDKDKQLLNDYITGKEVTL